MLNRFKENKEYIFLSFILFLGLLSRLYMINTPLADWHSFRQADTASVSRMYIEKGVSLLYPIYHDISTTQTGHFNPRGYRFVEFPIYNLLHVFLARSFQMISLEIWGRLVSILSALVSAFVIYLLGKRFISLSGGILASLFYLILPFNIYFTRVILPEPLAVTFGLLGLYFFVRYFDFKEKIDIVLSSIFFSFAILVKPYIIFYGIPVVYLALSEIGIKKSLKNRNFILMGLIVFIPFILWRLWMLQFPEGIPYWKWTFNGDGIRFRPSFWRWIFGERLSKLILGYWGLIPFVLGVLNLKKEKYKWFTHAFFFGVFVNVTVFATANVRHDYYQTLVIPAVVLFLASGCVYLWESKNFNKLLSRTVLLFSLFVMLITSAYQIRELYKINHPEIIKAGQAVQRLTAKDDLIIASYNGDTAFLYQTDRMGWPVVDLPINELIEKGAKYYVSVDLSYPQTQEFMQEFKTIELNDDYVIIDLINVE